MDKQFDTSSIAALEEVVRQLRGDVAASGATVIYLHGDLGTGKTTFAQHWLRQMGVDGAIPSPTYNIVNEYAVGTDLVLHADLYRIVDPEELLYLDVREWNTRAKLVLIEWPEQGKGYIPLPDCEAFFTLKGDTRSLLWHTKDHEA